MYGTEMKHIDPKIFELKDNHELEIMVVDDNQKNLKVLSEILKSERYKVRTVNNGILALKSLRIKPVDLVLLDVNMPEMTGYEVAQEMKKEESLSEIPIILITALSTVEDKLKGFASGAVDYITKPFMIEEVEARVKTHIRLSEAQKLLKEENHKLARKVNEKVEAITNAHLTTVFAMVEIAESRDDDTGKHVKRIAEYCKKMAELLKAIDYDPRIDDDFIRNIYIASPLHDIGIVGVRDSILLKPGKLTDSEFTNMREHVKIGGDRLDDIAKISPENDFIRMGATIARYHHEKYDGSGYLMNLSGSEIPIEARIMAIADVYDALRSKRIYKEAFSHEKAMAIISEARASQFDPTIVDVFLENQVWFKNKFDELSGVIDEEIR